MFDDGIELDYSERNVRCFDNRLTNVFQGISTQPIHGGPAYVYRNALLNVQVEPFKMHSGPSGALFIHNTVVKHGEPVLISTGDAVHNCFSRNNLYLGTGGTYAFRYEAPLIDCDFDYDGFGVSGQLTSFLKWDKTRLATLGEVKLGGPALRNAVPVDPATALASGLLPPSNNTTVLPLSANDLRLNPRSAAVDAGQVLAGFNRGFLGKSPDLGAYELGTPLPHYGVRPVDGQGRR